LKLVALKLVAMGNTATLGIEIKINLATRSVAFFNTAIFVQRVAINRRQVIGADCFKSSFHLYQPACQRFDLAMPHRGFRARSNVASHSTNTGLR